MKTKKAAASDSPVFKGVLPRLGVWAWSFVGIVAVLIILTIAFGAVSEIVMPLTFAAVLAVVFKPLADTLKKYGLNPNLAVSIVILGLVIISVGAIWLTVRGITSQLAEIGKSVDAAINVTDDIGIVNQTTLNEAKHAVEETGPILSGGFLTRVMSGVGVIVGIASGLILGIMIMYYFLKDGADIRRAIVKQFEPSLRKDINNFIGDACQILRKYGSGRTAMSTILAAATGIASFFLGLPLLFTIIIANFIGGYIPYIGGFIAGSLAVIVAFGQGTTTGFIMLGVVIAINMLLLNLVEPKVMGKALDLHPLLVLLVTTLGGLIGGIAGLILAAPLYLIAANAVNRLRKRDFFDQVAEQAKPAVKQMLD